MLDAAGCYHGSRYCSRDHYRHRDFRRRHVTPLGRLAAKPKVTIPPPSPILEYPAYNTSKNAHFPPRKRGVFRYPSLGSEIESSHFPSIHCRKQLPLS